MFLLPTVLLTACADLPAEQPITQTATPKPIKVAEMRAKEQEKEAKTSIDPDVMFMLLVAEIAGQREQYDVALEGYMEVAKRLHDPRFAERAAVLAMYMKDSPKTQEAVSLWLKRDAKNLTARKVAILSALRANDKATAVEHLSELIKADATEFENDLLELSALMQKENRLNILYDVLNDLSAKHPKEAVIYFVQTILAMQTKNTALAEQQIEKALAIKPNWDKALVLQAQIAMSKGDLEKAKSVIKTASAKDPKNIKLKKILAQFLIKAENYKEAGDIYKQLLAANPKDLDSKFTLALVYLQLDQDEKAEDILNELLEQEDWQDKANFYLGKIAEQQKETDKAVSFFDKVKDPDLAFDAALEAISVLSKDKQFDAVNQRINALNAKFPQQKQRILLIQAEFYNQQKQYQKAFDLMTAALAEQPDQPDLLYARALIAEHLKKQDIVEKDLKQILAKDPENVEALNALGYSLLDYPERYTEAEGYLKKAIELRPDEAVIIDSYGWLLFKQGKHQQALEYLQKAYNKQQENEIAAHITEVLWVLNRKDEAKKFFDKVFKNAPNDEYLLEIKQRILDKAK